MTFAVERGSGWALLRLAGDIDAGWIETNRDSISKFFENCPALVVVDLEPVTFMDSTGLGLLARCVKTCRANEGEVIAASPSRPVRKAIEVVGLDEFLTMLDTSAEQVIRDMPTVDDVV